MRIAPPARTATGGGRARGAGGAERNEVNNTGQRLVRDEHLNPMTVRSSSPGPGAGPLIAGKRFDSSGGLVMNSFGPTCCVTRLVACLLVAAVASPALGQQLHLTGDVNGDCYWDNVF